MVSSTVAVIPAFVSLTHTVQFRLVREGGLCIAWGRYETTSTPCPSRTSVGPWSLAPVSQYGPALLNGGTTAGRHYTPQNVNIVSSLSRYLAYARRSWQDFTPKNTNMRADDMLQSHKPLHCLNGLPHLCWVFRRGEARRFYIKMYTMIPTCAKFFDSFKGRTN